MAHDRRYDEANRAAREHLERTRQRLAKGRRNLDRLHESIDDTRRHIDTMSEWISETEQALAEERERRLSEEE
jgi:hypothetical protein